MVGAGTDLWSGELDGLLGRDAALARVRELIGEGRRTAVVCGMAGVGKSTLLTVAARAATADGWLVLSVSGHASERELAFAALVDLLSVAVIDDSARDSARRVLAGVLPGPSASPVEPLRLRLEVLAWLEQLAVARPVLVALDDAQWIDESSWSVLSFVANRVVGSGVSFLVAARSDTPPAGLEGHAEVDLRALDDREAALLLRRSGLGLDGIWRTSVVGRAAGNPLALLELGRAAAAAGASPRVPSSVEAAFAGQVALLTPQSRRVLLLAAAGATDLGVLSKIVGPGLAADVSLAETIGLVRVVGRRLTFRHPLARTAVYDAATTEERVGTHRALAAAYDGDPDRRIWHLAEASLVPDEQVAAALVEVAERARRRGANVEAARALARAADLSPLRADHERRLLDAVALNQPAGHFGWLAAVAGRIRDESDDPAIRAQASHYLAYALAQTARQDAARRALLDALDQLVDIDGFTAMASLTTLAYLAYSSGSGTDSVASWLARLEAVTQPPPPDTPQAHMDQACRYYVRAVIDPQRADDEVLALVRTRRYVELPEAPELLAAVEMSAGGIAWLLGETAAGLNRLGRALELMESMHYAAMIPQTLSGLGQVQFDAAMYDEVDHIGRLLVDLAEAEDLGFVGEVGRVLRAEVAGVRGDAVAARQLCDEVLLRLDPGQSIALECFVRLALGYARLGENDLAGSFEQLSGLFRADGEPVHAHISYLFLADTVAAGVRAGQAATLGPVMDVACSRLSNAPPRSRFQLARARALLAGDDAERFHLAATTDRQAAQWPFQLANAQLEYGVWLRRRRRQTAARGQLESSLDTFHRLGTRAWADLARAELRAAGVATEPASSAWADLTAQERHIVRMAASGMTNREIGASLYLSPRTVSAHLYNAFPKLGVTARSQLRDIVDARENR